MPADNRIHMTIEHDAQGYYVDYSGGMYRGSSIEEVAEAVETVNTRIDASYTISSSVTDYYATLTHRTDATSYYPLKYKVVRSNIKMAAIAPTADAILESIPQPLWGVLTSKQLLLVAEALHAAHQAGHAVEAMEQTEFMEAQNA
jgi:hypothetical protein